MGILKDTNGEYTTSPDGDYPSIAEIIEYELNVALGKENV